MKHWCACSKSWVGVSPHDHTHFSRHGGTEQISFCLSDRHLPPGQEGSHAGDTKSLSPGAHLPERQELLPGHPPEIRWAGNAKNRHSEMLWPHLVP